MATGRVQRRSKGRGPGRPRASSPATIHEAALELFLERGYGAVSVDDIARRAGVSRGTVFSYCESKADALWVALDAAIARAGEALEATSGDGSGRERGALDALVEAIVAAVEPWGRTPPVALRDARAMGAEAELRDGAPARLQPLVERAALALALAANGHLPTIIYSLFWRRFNAGAPLRSMHGGLPACVPLVVLPRVLPGRETSAHPVADFAIFPLAHPGVAPIP
ncbi:TetR/AcrR family transcriptional regulator, partial [Agrococcus sp. TF02-05]|uniref:TetR/AcrR family transcriptional regulator n=1 Tax=Agrococcus sp. TF02-05 TaxID=2815211 RepID=UPI001AA1701F